jgi:hypothetical protein
LWLQPKLLHGQPQLLPGSFLGNSDRAGSFFGRAFFKEDRVEQLV